MAIAKLENPRLRGCRSLMWVGLVATLVQACHADDNAPIEGVAEQAVAALSWEQSEEGGQGLPIRLTGSDGQGLALVSLRAEAIVQPPLAFTELHLTFKNPEARRREGRFEITLPDSAAISRFAMRIGDRFQEGEVVEKQRARKTYEDFLHRRQDPALLEQDAGNHFRARVFPIAPHEDKEIIVSYSQVLRDSSAPYRLHLSGLPSMDRLAIRVLAGPSELEMEKRRFAPNGDLILTGGTASLPNLAVRSGNVYMARVSPQLDSSPANVDGLTILLDTSASAALGYDARVERLGRLVDRLRKQRGSDFSLELFAFDQTCERVFAGPASRMAEVGLPLMHARMPLGASNLQAALSVLAKQASHARVLLVTDAVATAGEDGGRELTTQVGELAGRGVRRLDVLLTGGIVDAARAAQLATRGLPRPGVVIRERTSDDGVLAAITHKPVADLTVEVSGASWWWPRRVESLLPGQQVVVVANVPAGESAPEVRVGSDRSLSPRPLVVAEPLLRRAWARAKIDQMEASLDTLASDASAQRARLETEIIALSTRYRVLSGRTALLVLESEADYRRFGISRRALSDILTVGAQGLAVLDGAQRAGQTQAFARVEEQKSEGGAQEVAAAVQRQTRGRRADRVPPAGTPPSAGTTLSEPEPESAAAAAEVSRRAARPRAKRRAPTRGLSAQPPPPERLGGLARQAPSSSRLRQAQDVAPAAPAPSESAADVLLGLDRASSSGSLRTRAGGSSTARLAEGALVRERRIRGRVRMTQGAGGSKDFDRSIVVRAIKTRIRAIQACYERELRRDPALRGHIGVRFTIQPRGNVTSATETGNTTGSSAVAHCVLATVRRLRFNPGPPVAETFAHRFTFAPEESSDVPVIAQNVDSAESRRARREAARRRRARVAARRREREWNDRPKPNPSAALEGRLLSVIAAVDAGDAADALKRAWRWRTEAPGDVLALVALGHALVASEDPSQAARAYGSIIDLFRSRADLRRMAGNYLEGLGSPDALQLAVDSYRHAQLQRPDHPNSHRLYGWALVKAGQHEAGFRALAKGYTRGYPRGRFAGVKDVLADDLGVVAQIWKRAEPKARERIDTQLRRLGIGADTTPSLRFILSWETDANDVDFHVYDGKHGHAYYGRKQLPAGGQLFADVRNGYGPELFRIDRPKAYPFELSAHYYSRGPMGYGMGKVQIMHHDGDGGVRFDERPFVIMKERAFVHLGVVERNQGEGA